MESSILVSSLSATPERGQPRRIWALRLHRTRPHDPIRWVTSFPGNPAHGLPPVMGLVLLSDASNGVLRAVLDAGAVTAPPGTSAAARLRLPLVLAATHLPWGVGFLVGMRRTQPGVSTRS